MNILGLGNLDNASAAVLRDGRVVAACEEERLVRRKHYCGFPERAIDECLRRAGLDLGDIDEIAVGWIPYRGIVRRAATTAWAALATHRFGARAGRGGRYFGIMREQLGTRRLLARQFAAGPVPPVRFVNHHLAHLASAYFTSPFDVAAGLSMDGTGEYQTAMLASIEDGRIRRLSDLRFPGSLGHLYSIFTSFLGFEPNSGEGKVMGLAAYGRPAYAAAVRRYARFDAARGRLRLDPHVFDYAGALERAFPERFLATFGPPRVAEGGIESRHRDLAASVQLVAEEMILGLARTLHARTGLDSLCLSGGVAQNCVANARVLEETPFTRVFVPSAPSDAGVSLGAACYRYHLRTGRRPEAADDLPYLGPVYSSAECAAAVEREGLPVRRVEDPEGTAAGLLARGKVLGWFRGGMEFGPRALGARSILAAPFPAAMKDQLNRRVKFREPFRPFAPMVLEEAADEWFESWAPSPHMSFAFKVRSSRRSRIPAVTHVDGRARLQTVNGSRQPALARLLRAFGELTGVPVVLNTSFNVRGEPIVCSPEDAVACFLRTGMDYLFLEDCLVERPPA